MKPYKDLTPAERVAQRIRLNRVIENRTKPVLEAQRIEAQLKSGRTIKRLKREFIRSLIDAGEIRDAINVSRIFAGLKPLD